MDNLSQNVKIINRANINTNTEIKDPLDKHNSRLGNTGESVDGLEDSSKDKHRKILRQK